MMSERQDPVVETTVEARQADRRKMNLRVLFWALPAAIVLVGLATLLWK